MRWKRGCAAAAGAGGQRFGRQSSVSSVLLTASSDFDKLASRGRIRTTTHAIDAMILGATAHEGRARGDRLRGYEAVHLSKAN